MTRICLSLTGNTLKKNLDLIHKYRQWVDLAELRLDFLEPDEVSEAAAFPSLTRDLPAILTIRKTADGGHFIGTEEERKKIFLHCLSGPVSYRYVDLEEDFADSEIENRLKQTGTRIIRSFHDYDGVPGNLIERIQGLRGGEGEIPKAAVMPRTTSEAVKVFAAMDHFREEEAIILGMGAAGFPTRILSPLFGSYLTYSSEPGKQAAPGHVAPSTLQNIYNFHSLSGKTGVYGIIGNPVLHSFSPVIHNTGFRAVGLDGVYIPIHVDSVLSFKKLSHILGIRGFSVTHPFKEEVIGHLAVKGEEVETIGACNTVRVDELGWQGANFDWSGFVAPLKKLPDFSCSKALVIGAGGAARAAVYALRKAGLEVFILNRTPEKAGKLAAEFGCEWGPLDDQGIEKAGAYSGLIVQSTSIGMHPHELADPLEHYSFRGDEIVYDLIYMPDKTKLLERAEEAGCTVLNGKQMLLEQAYSQFEYFTGTSYPDEGKKALQEN